MLHLGQEHGNSQSAHLVGQAISTLGNLHKLAVESDQSEDSSQISPPAEEHSPSQSRVPQLNEEQIWKESYNLFLSLPDSAQTEDTLEHLVNKCYNDAHDALLCHFSFESDFYQLLNNILPTDKSPFKPLAFPVTTIDTGASTEMCARK